MSDNPTNQTPDPAARLAEIRAKRAQLADATEARLTPGIEEEIAIEERRLKEDEEFEKFQVEFGVRNVRLLRFDSGAVIIRKPHIAAYRKFSDSENVNNEAAEAYVKSCLLYPSKPEFDRIMRDFPGLLPKCAKHASELAGFRAADIQGK